MRAPDSILPVELRGLGFAVGALRILSDVHLTLSPGDPTIILGPNGAGKSVLLRLMHGLLAPTEGEIAWAGRGGDTARRQAMVFQRPVLLRRSALANVLYPLRLAGLPAREREERAAQALGLVGLALCLARLLHEVLEHPVALLRGELALRVAAALAHEDPEHEQQQRDLDGEEHDECADGEGLGAEGRARERHHDGAEHDGGGENRHHPEGPPPVEVALGVVEEAHHPRLPGGLRAILASEPHAERR